MSVPRRPRAALTLTLVAAVWIAGCGGDTATEIPATTPAPKLDAKGKDPGPPSAAGNVKPRRP